MLPPSTSDPENTSTGQDVPLLPSGYLMPFALVTVLFFLWGIPNNLNDVLIRQFMKSFVISRFEAGLIQSAFYMGYFVLAMPAALVMRKLGYKSGFMIGLALFSLGTALFWPAAIVARYSFFLVALFIIASGLSFLETAANPFIAQLGDPRTAARRLNLAQAFNPLGAITGVLAGTLFIFSGIELNPDPVSYTHLDVYKRQVQRRLRVGDGGAEQRCGCIGAIGDIEVGVDWRIAVLGGNDEQRVVVNAGVFECVDNVADGCVDKADFFE